MPVTVVTASVTYGSLASIRPFKIGDTITVFGIKGSVRDIGLLYVRMTTVEDRKIVLVPNSTMLGTAIMKEKIPSHEVRGTNP